MKDAYDNVTYEIDFTETAQLPRPVLYTAHLTLDDGSQIVWTNLSKAQAAAIYRANMRNFSHTHSSADMKRCGWGEQ